MNKRQKKKFIQKGYVKKYIPGFSRNDIILRRMCRQIRDLASSNRYYFDTDNISDFMINLNPVERCIIDVDIINNGTVVQRQTIKNRLNVKYGTGIVTGK